MAGVLTSPDLAQREQFIFDLAQREAMRTLCRALAESTGSDEAHFARLCGMLSPNLASLLYSPQGWAAAGKILVGLPEFSASLTTVH
ncbi:hypothetical protein SAMN05428984_1678 [Sphingomonas sp. OK281]|nr:hypothetical protein SAMN05428984_1678 [Sphingomonas sp. OK281]